MQFFHMYKTTICIKLLYMYKTIIRIKLLFTFLKNRKMYYIYKKIEFYEKVEYDRDIYNI